jgi:integrase
MNDGARGQKFFSSQGDAMKFAAERMGLYSLGIVTKAQRASSSDRLDYLARIYLAEKRAEGLAVDSINQISWALDLITASFGNMTPADLTPTLVEGWIPTLPYTTRGRFNAFAQGRTFFNWRPVRELAGGNPFADAKTPRKTDGDRIEVFTPDEMRTILAMKLPPWVRAKVVLGAFAGLRSCELERMTWDCIDWEDKEILVRKDHSKQGEAARPRAITLQDAVRRHLTPGKGIIVPVSNNDAWKNIAKEIGRDSWPKNSLRKSFCSYHLAHFRSAPQTAFEMGHTSATLVYQTYGNNVSKKDAAAWFSL